MNIQMIRKIQKLQKEMEKTQQEIHDSTFSSSANGLVSVDVKGDKTVLAIKLLDKDAIELDDLDLLTESIRVAINQAINDIDDETREKMGKYAQMAGMGL